MFFLLDKMADFDEAAKRLYLLFSKAKLLLHLTLLCTFEHFLV